MTPLTGNAHAHTRMPDTHCDGTARGLVTVVCSVLLRPGVHGDACGDVVGSVTHMLCYAQGVDAPNAQVKEQPS